MAMWELQARTPSLLVASIKSGKGTGLMIRLGDYCQGVARLDGFGLHVERWKRVGSNEGIGEWGKDSPEHDLVETALVLIPRAYSHQHDSYTNAVT
jgi:hypothetical protein